MSSVADVPRIHQSEPPAFGTLGDLVDYLGGIPLDRIRFRPFPGTATVVDVAEIQEREGGLCELVCGVLVEKALGFRESTLAGFLLTLLNNFVIPRNLGIVSGSDGTVQLFPDLVRIPDVAFTPWARFPNQELPSAPVPRIVPALVVEVLSAGNTLREMELKRMEYFSAGVLLVWEIDPRKRTVDVHESATEVRTLQASQVLDGGEVLPGFSVPVQGLFDFLERRA